jgi:hypothetical protein
MNIKLISPFFSFLLPRRDEEEEEKKIQIISIVVVNFMSRAGDESPGP